MTKHRLSCDSCDAHYVVVHDLGDYYEPSQCPFCGHEATEHFDETEEDE